MQYLSLGMIPDHDKLHETKHGFMSLVRLPHLTDESGNIYKDSSNKIFKELDLKLYTDFS